MRTSTHSSLRWRLSVTALAVAALAAGCASSVGKGSPTISTTSGTNTTPKAPPSATALADDPAAVALAFTTDIFHDRWSEARNLVYSGSLRTYDILNEAGKAQGDLHVSERNLAVAAVRRHGALADAVLTGTVCTAGRCVSNASTTKPNPVFVVRLRHAAGRWVVWYPSPASK